MIQAFQKPVLKRATSDYESIFPFIKDIKLFQDHTEDGIINREDVKNISQFIQFEIVPAGQCIYFQGDEADKFYILFDGVIDMLQVYIDKDGNLDPDRRMSKISWAFNR